jgi:asparagine synthase (glutamine-hydrolysing)
MCGIAGIYSEFINNLNPDYIAKNVCDSLIQRGPDFQKYEFINSKLLFCHTRLSILDQAANQPMWDDSHRYVLILNGEIFNYKDIKSRLISLGYKFITSSDTEVALYALIHFGNEALEMFNGFFSLAFYDVYENKLLLARDRFGDKPLYYFYNHGQLFFASEIKALRAMNISCDYDYSAIALYLFLTYIPSPFCAFENIKKLPPASYLIYDGDEIIINKYYNLSTETLNNDEVITNINNIKSLLEKSVQIRLNADVPVGTFLSGGIDSSIITFLAHKFNPDITAYTISFPDLPYYDESIIASKFAIDNNISHNIIPIEEKNLVNSINNAINYIDEPYADSSAIALYTLVNAVKPFVKVVLSGDGADELFGGYNKYRAWARLNEKTCFNKLISFGGKNFIWDNYNSNNFFSNKLRQLKKFSNAFDLQGFNRYFYLTAINDVFFINKILNPDIIQSHEFNEKINFLQEKFIEDQNILATDFSIVLEGDMLRKTDLMGMANSTEIRSPFLDYELVDNVFKIPNSFKFNKNTNKILIRNTFSDILPDYILNKPKHGFEVPIKKWMNDFLLNDFENKGLNSNFKFILNKNLYYNQNNLIKFAKNSDRLFYTLYVLNDIWNRKYEQNQNSSNFK